MKVGLLDTWLSRRYRSFWEAYLRALGVTLILPEAPFEVALKAPAPEWASLPLRAVLGRIDELKARGADVILLPDAQLGVEGERGGGQCPWVRDLESTVESLRPASPKLFVVPAALDSHVLGLAARLGSELVRNPQAVRLALERSRAQIKPCGPYRLPGSDAGVVSVGLVGEPYLIEEPRLYQGLLEALAPYGVVLADRAPEELRREGERLGLRLVLPSDLEWAGSAHYLARRASVKVVVSLVEPECEAMARVAGWIAGKLPKPMIVHRLDGSPEETLAALEGYNS